MARLSVALVGSLLSFVLAACSGGVAGVAPDTSAADGGAGGGPGTVSADGGSAPDGSVTVAPDASPGSDGGDPVKAARPGAPGPYKVTRTSTTVAGVAIVAFVPAVAAGVKVPLVVMKHGFQLATSNYAVLCERVATHGFVVAGVDTGGGIVSAPTNIEERDRTMAAIDWATMTAPFAASVAADRIAIMGHSRGGKVAVMVAAADPRVDAALLLDPVNGCGPGAGYSATCPDVRGAAFAGALTVPVGVMGETNNATGGLSPCAPTDQNYDTIHDAVTTASWRVEWTFTGADHMDFTDDGGGFSGSLCPDGPGDDTKIREQVRTMAVAFMRRHLRAELEMDPWLVGASVPADVTRIGP